MPLLSIIIPAYNSERFIANTLSMLVSQNLEDCEVIVVNDGSTDQTEVICNTFVATHKSIKLVNISNSGVSVARNTGLEQSQGNYVYFLDSDDTLTEGSIAFFKQVLLSGKNFQIFSFGYETRRSGKIVKRYIAKKYDKTLMDTVLLQGSFFSKKLPCHICSCIYDRVFLKENGLVFTVNLRIGEDIEFLIKSFSFSNLFYYESRLCFIYQIRDDSTMQGYKKYSIEQFNSFIVMRNAVIHSISICPDIKKEAEFFIAFLFFSNYLYYIKFNHKTYDLDRLFRQYSFFLKTISFNSGKISLNILLLLFRIFGTFFIKY
jgi:glycosyltransferase involved in cell wall biosynthesis